MANSPCTNGNDLGFYNSLDSRLPAQRPFDLNKLFELVESAYWEYPGEKLDNLFDTKMAVCKSIIEARGDNDFSLPHKTK